MLNIFYRNISRNEFLLFFKRFELRKSIFCSIILNAWSKVSRRQDKSPKLCFKGIKNLYKNWTIFFGSSRKVYKVRARQELMYKIQLLECLSLYGNYFSERGTHRSARIFSLQNCATVSHEWTRCKALTKSYTIWYCPHYLSMRITHAAMCTYRDLQNSKWNKLTFLTMLEFASLICSENWLFLWDWSSQR